VPSLPSAPFVEEVPLRALARFEVARFEVARFMIVVRKIQYKPEAPVLKLRFLWL